mmetsp:Transcript_21094/g.45894  ORF Transcript_21094/g.45894 Transcript_21094/m.45894 type:complete len:467 (-) Transcript_21094:1211-2611(-)
MVRRDVSLFAVDEVREAAAGELALDVLGLGVDAERADERLVAGGHVEQAARVEPIVAHVAGDHDGAVVRAAAQARWEAVRGCAAGGGVRVHHLVEQHHGRVLRVPERVELERMAHAMVKHRLSRVYDFVGDFAPLLLKHRLAFSERRQRRDEEVALQPSHLLLHLVDQIFGDGLAHGQSLEALRPAAALRTVRRERCVWPARRARGRRARAARLVAVLALLLKQRRHRDLPLIAFEERNLPRGSDAAELLKHAAILENHAVRLGALEHLAIPRAQLLALHRPALLRRARVEDVLVAGARRLDPDVHVLEAARAARAQVGAEQRAVGGGAVPVGLRAEVAHRVDVRDVDASRVWLRAVVAVLLSVHHEDDHLVAVDALQGHDGARAERELGGVGLAARPLALHHGLLGVRDALDRRDDAHGHALTRDARLAQTLFHRVLELAAQAALLDHARVHLALALGFVTPARS